MREPIRPANPTPKRSTVAGSGTEEGALLMNLPDLGALICVVKPVYRLVSFQTTAGDEGIQLS